MTEAELLFTHVLECERADLYLRHRRPLSADEAGKITSVLERRGRGEPLQYILGETEFMGLRFELDPSVLIPRPETEILVEVVSSYVDRWRREDARLKMEVLDVGTGSGCIAVSLAKLCDDLRVTALEISGRALEVARKNARAHEVGAKIRFISADFFGLRPAACGQQPFDIIVSNPPYIPAAEIDTLQPEVRQEPRIALDGGSDGLDFYRGLFLRAPGLLRDGGLLIVEIGCGQLEGIRALLSAEAGLRIQEVIKDYCGIERVVVLGKK